MEMEPVSKSSDAFQTFFVAPDIQEVLPSSPRIYTSQYSETNSSHLSTVYTNKSLSVIRKLPHRQRSVDLESKGENLSIERRLAEGQLKQPEMQAMKVNKIKEDEGSIISHCMSRSDVAL